MFNITCPNCNTSDGVEYIDDKSSYLSDTNGELYAIYKCKCGCYFKAVTSFKASDLKHEIVYSEVWDA